jgi:glycosyltransferase involved in cell wall biosynthesis
MFKVSVIIPVYNAANYIRRAVESVTGLAQTGEIILVEDCSPDHSLEVCKQLQKEYANVTVLTQHEPTNLGAGGARNLGIKAASFDFISFLDGDDYYYPNRFESEAFIFSNMPNVDGVYGFTQGVFENEEVKQKYLLRHPANDTFTEKVDPSQLLHALLFGGKGTFHTNGITLRKSVFQKVGYFDTELKLSQDTELWARLACSCILVAGNIESPIAARTVHPTNRVHAADEIVGRYRKLVYEKLMYWAIGQRTVGFSKMNQFFMAYHLFSDEKQHSAFAVLLQLLGKKPWLLTRSFFYRKLLEFLRYCFS